MLTGWSCHLVINHPVKQILALRFFFSNPLLVIYIYINLLVTNLVAIPRHFATCFDVLTAVNSRLILELVVY